MATTTLSSKGQIVIPAEIREELGLERGATFRVELRDGDIILVPEPPDEWEQYRGCLADESPLTEQLEEEREQDRLREEDGFEEM